MTVPVIRISFTTAEIGHICVRLQEILSTGQLSNGRYVALFEERFRDVLMRGQSDCVAVSNGTDAIEVVLRAADLAAGCAICPGDTSAATVWGVLQAGLRPIFVGCDEELQIDVDQVEEAIAWHRKGFEGELGPVVAVVATHIGGIVSRRIFELRDLCEREGLMLVEDAAHAHGASFGGVQAGAIGHAGTFSFFATKTVTSGEGGMISTQSPRIAERARIMRDQGKRPGTANQMLMRGGNFRLSEIAAAVGVEDVERWPDNLRRRREASRKYEAALSDLTQLTVLGAGRQLDRVLSLYKFVVVTTPALRRGDVPLSGPVYDLALHEQPIMYAEGARKFPGLAMHANFSAHSCLPLYPTITDDEIAAVVFAVRRALGEADRSPPAGAAQETLAR
jgi:perosamine synthetase